MTEEFSIPFNRASFDTGEFGNIKAAVENGMIGGDGPFCKEAEGILGEMHGGARVLLTPSCSHALEMAARLLNFQPGDEIIVPSFTFVTTVSAFVANGATPVYCDIDPQTLGLSLSEARKLISPRTRAICLVNYAGVSASLPGFEALCEEFNLVLIEDNAHGLGGREAGRPLGTFGAMSTLSFHETKNVTCGEGGALVLNDDSFVDRAEIIREKGTNRSEFFRGQADKYTWVDLGSSWVQSDLLAAVLVGQLKAFERIQKRRDGIAKYYESQLDDWALDLGVRLGPSRSSTFHLFYALFPDRAIATQFVDHLRGVGIYAATHYEPLHLSPFGRSFLREEQNLDHTESVAAGLVRLPMYRGIDATRLDRVIESVKEFRY